MSKKLTQKNRLKTVSSRTPQTAVFHESLPFALTPEQTLGQIATHFSESSDSWRQYWHQIFHRPIRIYALGALNHAHHGLNWVTQHMRPLATQGTVALRVARQTIGYQVSHGWQSTWLLSLATIDSIRTYFPPLTDDIARNFRRLGRGLRHRKAKIAYTILASTALVSGGTVAAVMGTNILKNYANTLASPAALMAAKRTGITILDRNGTVLYQGYGAQVEGFVPIGELPEDLKYASLAAEDPKFYEHLGVSFEGTARAVWVDVTHGSTREGGSTLTQQLVKNTLLTQDKTFTRKFKELLLALNLERRYSKDQILEMYVNDMYYGQGAAGVTAAAKVYFHKDVRQLSLGESALLAGLPLGPNRFDPNFDLEAATGRRDYVLNRMAELGYITQTAATEAKAQPLVLSGAEGAIVPTAGEPITIFAREVSIKAPHFVFYVLNQLRSQYGDEAVETGGLTVRTTLDYNQQSTAQELVTNRVASLQHNNVTNGALVSLDPMSGDVLAMVGSIGYATPGFGSVNVTLAERQPGSSFKPFAYVTAFKKGWNSATIVDDSPMRIPQLDGTIYEPKNYDLQWHGRLTLRKALDNSFNIPAIKVIQYAGIHDTLQTAKDMGITSLGDESRFGVSLVLGSGEVSPLQMAGAYGTFANSGNYVPPRSILEIKDRFDTVTYTAPTPIGTPALDSRYAYMITNILSDDSSRQPEFPANGPLKLSRPAAAKTGTTNDFRDNWTVGYTPQLVTAVWVGNNDNTPMSGVDGITGAAPIWHDYMEAVLANQPVQNFNMPAGLTMASVCPDGSLAEGFQTGITEVFLNEALPTTRCHPKTSESNENKPDGQDPEPTTDEQQSTDPEIIGAYIRPRAWLNQVQ